MKHAPSDLDRARALRRLMTEAEAKLWKALRNRQLDGAKFRRQQPVEGYFGDFICLENDLIIEVDGGQHATRAEQDRMRTQGLAAAGFRVIRFWNNEVLENMEGVLASISAALKEEIG